MMQHLRLGPEVSDPSQVDEIGLPQYFQAHLESAKQILLRFEPSTCFQGNLVWVRDSGKHDALQMGPKPGKLHQEKITC